MTFTRCRICSAQGRDDDADLYACDVAAGFWGEESAGYNFELALRNFLCIIRLFCDQAPAAGILSPPELRNDFRSIVQLMAKN